MAFLHTLIPSVMEVRSDLPGLSFWIFSFLPSLILLLMFARHLATKKKYKLPPKVPGCPLLGNVFGIDRLQPHITMTSWAKRHGDIYTLRVLNENIIVVNSIELIREALITKSTSFAGRPYLFRIDYGFHYSRDIIFGDYSPKWCYLKKVAAQALRMYGCGVEHVEEVVRDEMTALTHSLEVRRGQPFDPRVTLMTAVVNALTASVIGKRYDHDDARMLQYKMTTRLFSETCSPTRGMELDLFPWLRHFNNPNFKKLTHARLMLDNLINEELQSAKERYDSNNVRCILDVLFKTQDEAANNNDDVTGLAVEGPDVRNTFIDLLVSGTFTTAISLSTFVLLMMNFPALQRELKQEVTQQIGTARLPSGGDRPKLPVVESFILELLRYLSHVPLSLPHFSTQDATLGGYDVPKDTKVLLNFWAVHHDPRVWDDPWRFDHKRFLSETGSLLPPTHPKRKCLVPFGGGKRMCMGETMARERLFLFITCLLQQFEFHTPEGSAPPSPDPRDFDLGLILEPKPFETSAVPKRLSTDIAK